MNLKTEWLSAARTEDIQRAADLLKNGGLVGLPTETVYGLAANALDGGVVKKIFLAKGRPQDNPLIVHVASVEQVAPLVQVFPAGAQALAKAYWPGPLTIILPKADCIPLETSAGLPTVAVRFPAHPAAQAVIRACGLPLAAPSGNLSGRPSPTTAQHMWHDMQGRIDAVLDGGPCEVGVESTVVTLAGERPRLLRPGGITLEQLQAVLGPVDVDEAVLNRLPEGETAASPGMKYKHYAPNARVIIIKGTSGQYAAYVNSHAAPGVAALCYKEEEPMLQVPCISYGGQGDDRALAHELFRALRAFDDDAGVKLVYARCPEPTGLGMAVYNRLIRAAGFEVLQL